MFFHPQKYVQDCMQAPAEAQQLLHDICDEAGHVYVCGDVSMADQVKRTVQVGTHPILWVSCMENLS